jgi:hypothetical protein
LFFIILAFTTAAFIIAVLLIKIRIELIVVQKDITINIIIFGFIKFKKRYSIKREEKTFLALYSVNRKGVKKIAALKDIARKLMKDETTEITLVELVKLFTKMKTEPKNNTYGYIYRRMKYDLKIYILAGTGDAYSTSMICGFLGSLSSALCAVFNDKAHKTRLSATPEFSKQVISVKVNCIIGIAAADIIIGYLISKKNKAVRKNASN